jgi:hypothetical protein
MPIELCIHKANPKACPTCFRLTPPKPKDPVPNPAVRQGVPMAPVMGVGEATMRATQRAAAMQTPIMAPANNRTYKEPFSSGHHSPPPEAFNPEKLWSPPVRKDLIDQQPRHPHIDKSVMR